MNDNEALSQSRKLALMAMVDGQSELIPDELNDADLAYLSKLYEQKSWSDANQYSLPTNFAQQVVEVCEREMEHAFDKAPAKVTIWQDQWQQWKQHPMTVVAASACFSFLIGLSGWQWFEHAHWMGKSGQEPSQTLWVPSERLQPVSSELLPQQVVSETQALESQLWESILLEDHWHQYLQLEPEQP